MNKFNQIIQYPKKQSLLHNLQNHNIFICNTLFILLFNSLIYSNQSETKKILIITEGSTDLKSFAYATVANLVT